jgi:CTP synthase
VIDSMIEQRGIVDKGGTMRLGAFKCRLQPKSLALKIYGKNLIFERHRHRFEFNNKYKDLFAKNGLRATGINEERDLVEILENTRHPWFIGVQYHPEFKSKPLSPHPLFAAFVKASIRSPSKAKTITPSKSASKKVN